MMNKKMKMKNRSHKNNMNRPRYRGDTNIVKIKSVSI